MITRCAKGFIFERAAERCFHQVNRSDQRRSGKGGSGRTGGRENGAGRKNIDISWYGCSMIDNVPSVVGGNGQFEGGGGECQRGRSVAKCGGDGLSRK